jgi:hypothetical protein
VNGAETYLRKCSSISSPLSELPGPPEVHHPIWYGNTYILGDEAERRNAQTRIQQRLIDNREFAWCRLINELIGKLMSGELLAACRCSTLVAPLTALPPSAWKVLTITDFESSIAVSTVAPQQTYFDVRVFKAAEFPRRLEDLGRAEINIETKNTSEAACYEWLVDIIRSSPGMRTENKSTLREKAKSRWPTLATRAFNRVRQTRRS